jgi:uncharacterized protein (UPF0261 family)
LTKIVVVGTYDTKSKPLQTLERALVGAGETPVTIDTGVFRSDAKVTYPASAVAEAGGADHQSLGAKGRAKAVRVMAQGAATILNDLVSKGEVGALVLMGGSNASTVFTHLVTEVPLGIPKLLMATSVSGDVRALVDAADTILFYPVVDVDGDNSILRAMIKRLADTAIVVKSNGPMMLEDRERRVALSMYGVTTPCVQLVERHLRILGVEPLVFHANGAGGTTIERFAKQWLIDAVADLTLAELGNEVVGGAYPAGPDRMTSARRTGLPQVIAPGAIDMIAFGPGHTLPSKFKNHLVHAHNDLVTLVRTTPEECHAIGKCLAERLGNPEAETVVCVPMGGTSMMDKPGEVFHDPEAVQAFHAGFVSAASPSIQIETTPKNINDPDFAARIFGHLARFLDIATLNTTDCQNTRSIET